MAEDDFQRNRLAGTFSPYLHQHADNPVWWQPWEEATLAHARARDKPILLSIGYSACHWCHVMAHECFEGPGIAAAMNASFINIKLDREERPDIDQVYQLAHQALTGRGGGWPLTVFLDPQNLSPFYIGTYFPPTASRGLPGFAEVLSRVRTFFGGHRNELRAQADELRAWLHHVAAASSAAVIDAPAVQTKAIERVAARFDARWGGGRGAPKFPRAAELEWLLDARAGDETARAMATLTLTTMATRGLQDHLGGGFFRYCTDESWTIPHFEKMLYDNAQLLPVYARQAADPEAGPAERDVAAKAARGIGGWLAREMRTPDGAFYSSVDADSKDGEGGFYVWTREQVRAALPAASVNPAECAFGLDGPPNFEDRAWHLLRACPLAEVAAQCGRDQADVEAGLARAREALFTARDRRAHPARDEKVLTAWNALAISALARSARLLDDQPMADMAHEALAALNASVWHDGALAANVAPPEARIPGFLDDHAFLLDALLETLQLRFDPADLQWAMAVADALLARFADPAERGFRFSGAVHGTPLVAARRFADEALPNGNAIAIRSLLRLGHLLDATRYLNAAADALKAAGGLLEQHPEAACSLLRTLREAERPRPQIVVRCPGEKINAWRDGTRAALREVGLLAGGDAIDVFIIADRVAELPGLLAERRACGARGTAYLCAGMTCQAPVDSTAALGKALRETMPA